MLLLEQLILLFRNQIYLFWWHLVRENQVEVLLDDSLEQWYIADRVLWEMHLNARSKHSAKTASIYFCNSIRKQMNNGKLTGAVYVDLSKAFDIVGHSVLLQKSSTYWVKDAELEWFNSYLFNRKNYVCVDRNISSPEPYTVEFSKDRSWGHYCLLFL